MKLTYPLFLPSAGSDMLDHPNNSTALLNSEIHFSCGLTPRTISHLIQDSKGPTFLNFQAKSKRSSWVASPKRCPGHNVRFRLSLIPWILCLEANVQRQFQVKFINHLSISEPHGLSALHLSEKLHKFKTMQSLGQYTPSHGFYWTLMYSWWCQLQPWWMLHSCQNYRRFNGLILHLFQCCVWCQLFCSIYQVTLYSLK